MKTEKHPGLDELTSFFARDHRLIDVAFDRFHHEAAPERALSRLNAFEGMLLRHIGWEEQLLFPAFEDKLGAEARACTSSMRIQHDEFKLRLVELRRAVGEGTLARRNAEEVLIEALSDHNHAEEDFIYPWMDSVLTPAERQGLLEALGRTPDA